MSKRKKSGNKDKVLQTIVLITAIVNLISSIVDAIIKLMK